MYKKYYRVCFNFFIFWILKIIDKILLRTNIKILPPLGKKRDFKYDFSKKTRRLVFRKDENRFGKIIFDSSLNESYLCELGKKFNTNKSGINLKGHRSGYTNFYNLILHHLKDRNCSIAEIGIEKNASTKMWRKYFKNATIDCFEIDKKKILFAKKHKLRGVKYHLIDVSNKVLINSQFQKTKRKFDLIIDDSTHLFNHQINIIFNTYRYLKKGGILIIEDIYRYRRGYEEQKYYNYLQKIKKNFSDIVFVETSHINNYTASWDCEKILLLIKK